MVKKVLEGPPIRTDVQNQEAADARRVVTTTLKFIGETRRSVTKPLDQAKKAAMNLFRPMTKECDDALELIDEKMNEWEEFVREEAEAKRAEVVLREEKRLAQLRRNEEKKLAEAKSREERLEIQRAYEDKKEIVKDEAVAAEQTVVEEPTQTSGTQVRKLWEFEVLDVMGVPDEYLIFTVNRKSVLEFCREMHERGRKPEIRGLRLFQKPSRASQTL